MIWIALVAVVIVFLALIFLKLALSRMPLTEDAYKKAVFLSPAEKDFLKALDSAIGDKYRIFAKVRLADLITPTAGDKSSWRRRFNRVNSKHVDFLLCDMAEAEPVCAIELDDRTHQGNSRVERDDFLNHALESAGIPIARFPVTRTYVGTEIVANIESATYKVPRPVQTPSCPKCGKQMVMRKAKAGANAGHSIWDCPGYPDCRGIVSMDESIPRF